MKWHQQWNIILSNKKPNEILKLDKTLKFFSGFINFNRSAEASGSDPNKPLNQVNAAKAAEALNTINSRYLILGKFKVMILLEGRRSQGISKGKI